MSFKDKLQGLIDRKVADGQDRIAAISEVADQVDLTVLELIKLLDVAGSDVSSRTFEDHYCNERILSPYRDKRSPEQLKMIEAEEEYMPDISGF